MQLVPLIWVGGELDSKSRRSLLNQGYYVRIQLPKEEFERGKRKWSQFECDGYADEQNIVLFENQ